MYKGRNLPNLCRAKREIHKDEIKLERPEINTLEIGEMPKEVKLEIPMEQKGSKLG